MHLPRIFPISPNIENSEDLNRLLKLCVSHKYNVIQFRMKELSPENQLIQLMNAEEMCLNLKIELVINSYHLPINRTKAKVLHLTSGDLMRFKKDNIPNFSTIGASCHNANEVHKANELNLDYIFISPVLRTDSHSNSLPLGWHGFQKLSALTKIPSYSLGGMKILDLEKGKKKGAIGIAGISLNQFKKTINL